jgi:hypothetical protein
MAEEGEADSEARFDKPVLYDRLDFSSPHPRANPCDTSVFSDIVSRNMDETNTDDLFEEFCR